MNQIYNLIVFAVGELWMFYRLNVLSVGWFHAEPLVCHSSIVRNLERWFSALFFSNYFIILIQYDLSWELFFCIGYTIYECNRHNHIWWWWKMCYVSGTSWINVWKVGGLLPTVCRPLGWCLGLLGHLRVEPWCKTAAVLWPMVD